ncbi:DNA mismatch repair protein [Aspergillus hancockii]|nr:DNA mismatch repair protein [Aspergillus hancockii]
MSLNSHRIDPLPPEVIAKLKSSTSITHLNGVVLELVKNALDAEAHTVKVTIDFGRGGCKVEDDGNGIPPTEFEPSGGLGKAHLQQELGFHGHGTSVTVNDLFGNMPVRVKNRALALQKPDEVDRQWDELRQLLVSLMIANDNLTKLMITDVITDKKINIWPRTRSRRTDNGLNLQRIGSILAQAGLIDYQYAGNWDAAYASVPDFSIHAAISLVPSPTKKVQFVSVGMDPVLPRSSVNLFYSEVNRLFSLSEFGTTGTPSVDAGSAENLDHHSGTNIKPTTKSVNKWPMFYVRIDTNEPHKINGEGQGIPESEKSVQQIMDVLTAMIHEFLKQHNLRPRSGKRRSKTSRKDPSGETSSKSNSARSHLDKTASTEEALGNQLKLPNFQKSAPRACQSFKEWSRIKSAKESLNAHSTRPKTKLPRPENAHGIEQPLAQESLPTEPEQAKHKKPEEPQQLLANSDPIEDNDDSERHTLVPWIEPYTGSSHLVNSRTARYDTGADKVPTRIHDGSAELCGFDNLGLSKFRGKLLRKQDLETAEVVAQVDQKFILAKLKSAAANDSSSDTDSILVLIDQHAADERCRVESLLEELFTTSAGGYRQVKTVTLEPLIFEIPSTEAYLFGRYTNFFKFWGVHYTARQDPANKSAHIFVHKLPTLIAERCRLEPNLVTNLIRGEIWKREEDGSGSRTSFLGLSSGTSRWAEQLDSCPQGIVELLNSRACRTAIMFNDVLTIDECQNLVKRLARCVFPFQCAHGRPSMIPILDMTSNLTCVQPESEYAREEGKHLEFAGAFRTWREGVAFHLNPALSGLAGNI